MSNRKNKIARIFMFTGGLIFLISGIIVILAEKESLKNALIDNFAFFLSGGILVYLEKEQILNYSFS